MQKNIYLILTILGLILPYSILFSWFLEHGLDGTLIIQELFANKISSAFGLDIIISAVVLVSFIMYEGKKLAMNKLWIPIVGTFFVGVSFGLPLFLYMREKNNK